VGKPRILVRPIHLARFLSKDNIDAINDKIHSEIFLEDKQLSIAICLDNSKLVFAAGLSRMLPRLRSWLVDHAIFPNGDLGNTFQKAILAYACECCSAASAPAQEAAVVVFDTILETDFCWLQLLCST
jgi:aspartate aminotransferase